MKVLCIILGVLMIAGGICCLALPEITFLMLGYIIGIVMLLDGVERLILWFQRDRGTSQSGWTLVSAIFSFLIGLMIIGNDILQLVMDTFIIYMTIGWLLLLGFLRIAHAFQVRKLYREVLASGGDNAPGRDWWIALVFGILLVACGIIGFFAPTAVGTTLGIMVGIALMISGFNMIHFGTTSWMLP